MDEGPLYRWTDLIGLAFVLACLAAATAASYGWQF